MTDSYVQVPPDSTGKLIDTSEITTAEGKLVERQRVVLADPTLADALAEIVNGALVVRSEQHNEILGQLKRIATLLELHTKTSVSLKDAH